MYAAGTAHELRYFELDHAEVRLKFSSATGGTIANGAFDGCLVPVVLGVNAYPILNSFSSVPPPVETPVRCLPVAWTGTPTSGPRSTP